MVNAVEIRMNGHLEAEQVEVMKRVVDRETIASSKIAQSVSKVIIL